jgi:hypothetical protein
VKLLGGPSPVVPRMAEKDVPKVRQGRSLLDAFADRRERPHLGSRIHHGRTRSRPARPSAAAGPADTAPAAAAALRRGVGRIRRPVAAIAATACGAGRCSARCAMAIYWCCASCHVADNIKYQRRFQSLAQVVTSGAEAFPWVGRGIPQAVKDKPTADDRGLLPIFRALRACADWCPPRRPSLTAFPPFTFGPSSPLPLKSACAAFQATGGS